MIGPRDPREHWPDYMAWIATLPCIGCFVRLGRPVLGVHVAHCRQGYLGEEGWRPVGKAEKPHDWRTTPLCPACHMYGRHSQHASNEEDWWEALHVFPPALCAALIACFRRGGSGGFAVIAQFAAQARRAMMTGAAP